VALLFPFLKKLSADSKPVRLTNNAMAYDTKTYGQSPFGAPKPKDGSKDGSVSDGSMANGVANEADKSGAERKLPEKALDTPAAKPNSPAEDDLDQGPRQVAGKGPAKSSGLASRFPNISGISSARSFGQPAVAKSHSQSVNAASSAPASNRKSRNTASKSSAKSKKSQATAKADVEAAELAIARRFAEEDRSAYLSLLYKTGVSGLVWAVLRLSRYELSKEAIAFINIAIHPTVIAAIAFAVVLGLTFWTRRLLNDLARHTQQLHTDAEAPDGKSFRPTLEIVGDALEYNPKLRKNFARLFDAASILVCSLVSYLITFALFPNPS
jgi:hypothetical protein